MPPKRRNIAPPAHRDRPAGPGLRPRPVGGRWRFCRGRPMCRPGHGSSRDPSAGGHIGPPLHEVGWCSGSNGDWRRTGPPPRGRNRARPWRRDAPGERRGVVTPPYGSNTGGVQRRADVGIGPYGDRGRAAGVAGPYGSNAGGTRQTGRYRAFLGQTRVHSRQRMHSVAFFRRREGSVMSTPMGQTARQRPQWTHFVSSHFTRIREK